MEIELRNFKVEVVKRFNKSKITEYKFPRKLSTEEGSEKNKLLFEQWKTIDNYYQK